MHHTFNPDIAKIVGVNAAILYANIKYWCKTNRANDRNFYEGRYWTYNSIQAYNRLFPYLTPKQVRSALDVLYQNGFVTKAQLGISKNDYTNWYSDLHPGDMPEMADPLPCGASPLPCGANATDINPLENQEVTSNDFSSQEEKKQTTSSPLKAENQETQKGEQSTPARAPARAPARDPDPDESDYAIKPVNNGKAIAAKMIKWVTAYLLKNPDLIGDSKASLVSRDIVNWLIEEKNYDHPYGLTYIPKLHDWVKWYFEAKPVGVEIMPAATKCMRHLMGGERPFRTYIAKYPDIDAHMYHAWEFGNAEEHISMFTIAERPLGQDFYEWKNKTGSMYRNEAYYESKLKEIAKRLPL